ncbi:MAG: hypothetical protein M1840_004529 [Geoglossum simile]|nr:MAG: hypothetical protein M1840_004529 [Geoglossum simile]
MNGFILNGRPLLVEPKRQIRVSSDRNLRKFSGNSSGTPPEYQIGVASQETNPHAHKAPGGASGLFSQLHRDGKQMAGQYPPCIPVPTPKQSGARILDSLPGYEGSIRPMSPSPQNQHLQGPTAVDVSVRELTTHSRDSNNLAFHGPPTNNDTDYPPLNASIGPIHNGVDGVPPSKSPKKFKRAKGGKKQVGRRNARNEADNLRSSVHNAQVKKLVAEAIPFSHSSNASESGIIKPKSDGVNRRFSF